jgi:tetratricopeptide (TPR) repeat protein
MDKGNRLQLLLLALFISACASFAVGGQFSSGRRALIAGDPQTALEYFTEVAQKDPNYIYVIQNYRQSIWTYLGRAQYEAKGYQEARASLERALAINPDDSAARLYLGLTLIRLADRSGGLKELAAGMKDMYEWIEYMNRTRPFQAFWDPTYQIRKQIDQDLAALETRDVNPDQLIADAEWIGKMFEEELDKVREDERRQFQREQERDRRGPSVGFGIGF